ncbi:hypothetical protein F2P79_018759 [Pimephales promelas]|nr:hypothetical protein F2P79_018759 [Pimephales promelas]
MDLSGAPEKKKRLRSFNKEWEKKNQKKNQSDEDLAGGLLHPLSKKISTAMNSTRQDLDPHSDMKKGHAQTSTPGISTPKMKKLLEEATTASQKDAELQNELHQQESLREKAQELETAKREELERKVDKDDQLGSLEKKLKEMEGLFLHRGSGHPTVLHALSENAHRGAQGRDTVAERAQHAATEDNGCKQKKPCKIRPSLSHVLNAFAQLARAEEDVTKLTLAHESSLAELNEAVTHRECLSEQEQILQGKISVLEDELLKAQSPDRGEVLGPIMEVLTKIESLQTRILERSEQISLKDEEIRNLRNEPDSVERELKLKKLLEEATTASQKDAELLLLQNELHQQESLREKAQELETAKREELERTVDKDDQLGSLEKKLKEMEGLFLHRCSTPSLSWREPRRTLLKLTLAHESSLAELNEAVTHRECLSEQEQILQGKISVLEDELLKAQSPDRGEVLGPIMEVLTKIESLQTRILERSEQISLKDEEIRNLRNEPDSVERELKLLLFINKPLLQILLCLMQIKDIFLLSKEKPFHLLQLLI